MIWRKYNDETRALVRNMLLTSNPALTAKERHKRIAASAHTSISFVQMMQWDIRRETKPLRDLCAKVEADERQRKDEEEDYRKSTEVQRVLSEARPSGQKCSERGCPFPARVGEMCRQHYIDSRSEYSLLPSNSVLGLEWGQTDGRTGGLSQ